MPSDELLLPAHFDHCLAKMSPAGCQFLTTEELKEGVGRLAGLPPAFTPFASTDDGDWFGFYPSGDSIRILRLDSESRCLKPIASDFGSFLGQLCLVSHYDAALSSQDDERELRSELVRRLDIQLPDAAKNESELHLQIVQMDAGAAASLCYLGCDKLMKREDAAALELFARASGAAPYFGDAHFLIGDTYRDMGAVEKAMPHWWRTVSTPMARCTHSSEWNLGEEYPEGDIYEIATDCLIQHEETMLGEWSKDPLWKLLRSGDIYSPAERETLGDSFLSAGADYQAEREYLNAIFLSAFDTYKFTARVYDKLISLYESQSRTRESALAVSDRNALRKGR